MYRFFRSRWGTGKIRTGKILGRKRCGRPALLGRHHARQTGTQAAIRATRLSHQELRWALHHQLGRNE